MSLKILVQHYFDISLAHKEIKYFLVNSVSFDTFCVKTISLLVHLRGQLLNNLVVGVPIRNGWLLCSQFWTDLLPVSVSLIVSFSSSTNPRGEGARPSAVHHSQRFHWSTQKFSIPSKFESSSSFSFIYWFIFTVTGSTNLPLVLLGFGLNLKKSFLSMRLWIRRLQFELRLIAAAFRTEQVVLVSFCVFSSIFRNELRNSCFLEVVKFW
jgi:hypothetical protein